jgi:Mn2+/Fe2+ NRAMP family transporter
MLVVLMIAALVGGVVTPMIFLITHLAQPPWIRYKPRTNKGFGRRDADGSQCGAVPERA